MYPGLTGARICRTLSVVPASNLTEKIEARVDFATKVAVAKLANNTARSEGAIVRLALRDYLKKAKV